MALITRAGGLRSRFLARPRCWPGEGKPAVVERSTSCFEEARMRKRRLMEIVSIEETEVESLDETDGDAEVERPHPPVWHRRCRWCDTVYNVLKVKCPNCGKKK